jgi:hypothetical protein
MNNDLMTFQSLATLGGASFATTTVANVCQQVFNFNPRWLALLVAELIMLGVTWSATGTKEIGPYLIALINGTIVYCAAIGANTLTGRPHPTQASGLGANGGSSPVRRSFWTRWF